MGYSAGNPQLGETQRTSKMVEQVISTSTTAGTHNDSNSGWY